MVGEKIFAYPVKNALEFLCFYTNLYYNINIRL